ncbi:MAG: 4Fe-4S binding protein [Spirochaetes bacterium]|nr:4Fe-4S binding protein [Spirochaetota bacterium]MBU0954554.1 4Fe-4S binding protein [Spirochaetota bacterium]
MKTLKDTTVGILTNQYLAVQSTRQRLRNGLMLIWLLLMPVTLFYFSPYLPFMGLLEGVISGSILVFIGLAASSMVLGRSFCGWFCPAGAVQDIAYMARPKLVKQRILQWIKFALWTLWIGAWISLAVSGAGVSHDGLKIDFFYQMENGISVSRPAAYIIYLSVLVLILTLSFSLGRRGFCHVGCWMAPFMVIGQKLGIAFCLPGLHIRGDQNKCTTCGKCTVACPMSLDVGKQVRKPNKAAGEKKSITIAHHDCILCMRCVDVCPSKVLCAGFGARS